MQISFGYVAYLEVYQVASSTLATFCTLGAIFATMVSCWKDSKERKMAEPPDLLPPRNSAATSSPLALNPGVPSQPDFNSFPPLPSSARNFRSENLNHTIPNSNSTSNPENPQIGQGCILSNPNSNSTTNQFQENPQISESRTLEVEKSTWASKLGSKGIGKTKLSYIPPTMVNGEAIIHLESRMFEKIQKRNEDLVIGSFVTKRYSFSFVLDIIKRVWKPKQPITMKLYGKKSFSFEFANDDDKAQALEIGNLYIASQPFIVRPWKLFIEADLKNLDTLPIWALFKDIPEELRDADGYSRLASAIGTPLYTDRKTELKGGGDYARICIDVKASSKFPTVVPVVVDKVKVFKVAVTYNWKPPKCPHCLIFGHDENNCPKYRQVKPITLWVPKEKAPSNTGTNVERVQLEETGSQEQGNQEKGINAEVMEISEPSMPLEKSSDVPPTTNGDVNQPSLPLTTPNLGVGIQPPLPLEEGEIVDNGEMTLPYTESEEDYEPVPNGCIENSELRRSIREKRLTEKGEEWTTVESKKKKKGTTAPGQEQAIKEANHVLGILRSRKKGNLETG